MKKSAGTYRKHKLKGGALIYVILLSLLISGILSALLLINYYQGSFANKSYFYSLAQDNLQSGLEWVLATQPTVSHYETALFDSPIDSFSMQKETWGLFHLLHAQANHGPVKLQRSCLIGERIPKSYQFSLYLTDKRQPLILTGNTLLKGKLFVPASGIRTGNVGRISYQRQTLFEGTSSNSNTQSKSLKYTPTSTVIPLLSSLKAESASLETYMLQDAHIQQDWKSPVKRYDSPYSLLLENCEILDKVIIFSPGEIEVKANSRLRDCILLAPKIRIAPGFEGSLQAFATESISLGAGATLAYPSVLMLAKQGESAQLSLAEHSEVQGAVIFDTQLFRQKIHREDFVSLATESRIYGSLFAQHNLDLQGKVFGQVITDGFLLRTPAALYRNHLMHAEIDWEGLHPDYTSPLIFGGEEQTLIKWF